MPLNKHKILIFHCRNWYRTTSFTIGKRRRRETSDCKPTPSTPVCSNVLADLKIPSRYFRTTFQYGNYFGHDSTDEAVYELSKFANLLSSLLAPDDPGNRRNYTFCYQALTILLCHLHLPVCPRSPLHEHSCLDSVGNTSACFDAIKDLNSKGANFAWPPVKVNCENKTWFRSDQEDIISGNNLGRIHNRCDEWMDLQEGQFRADRLFNYIN